MRWRSLLDGAASLAMIVAAASIVWVNLLRPHAAQSRSLAVPKDPVSIIGVPARGSGNAKVAIIEFADFECPYCRRFAQETLPLLDREYISTGKVIVLFRHAPLDIHPLAFAAAKGAACAGNQELFWEMHDTLFQKQIALDQASLRKQAEDLGLDSDEFGECLTGSEAAHKVQGDALEAKRLGIVSTPTFLFGSVETGSRVRIRNVVSGAESIESFRVSLDRMLEQVK